MSKAKTQKAGSGISSIKWAYVLISVFLIALGVCTFIWPEITLTTICCSIGAASVVFGIIKILTYFMREPKGVGQNYDFSIGALTVIAGLVLLISRDKIVDLLQMVIGAYLIIDSVFKLQTALDAKRLGVSGWWLSLILTIACLGLGSVLVFKAGENLLMILIGAALVADGLQNLFLVIFSAAAAKALERREKEAGANNFSEEKQSAEPPEASAQPASAAEQHKPVESPEKPTEIKAQGFETGENCTEERSAENGKET